MLQFLPFLKYLFMNFLIGGQCSWFKLARHRSANPLLSHMEISKDPDESAFSATQRTPEASFSIESPHYITSISKKNNQQLEEKNMILNSVQDDVIRRWLGCLPLLCLNGVFLSLHFVSWSWSIEKTSLTHSLLLVSCHPVLIVFGAWVIVLILKCFEACTLRSKCKLLSVLHKVKVPTHREAFGTALSMAGMIVMVFGIHPPRNGMEGQNAERGPQTSVEGDLAALLGAAMMVFYLLVGDELRTWMPLWLYVFPVNLFAAITTSLLALLFESNSMTKLSKFEYFGWLKDQQYFVVIMSAACISGILGHTLANFTQKYLSPLLISIFLLAEPLVGSVMGYCAGVQSLPTVTTWAGGSIVLFGAGIVVLKKKGCTPTTSTATLAGKEVQNLS